MIRDGSGSVQGEAHAALVPRRVLGSKRHLRRPTDVAVDH